MEPMNTLSLMSTVPQYVVYPPPPKIITICVIVGVVQHIVDDIVAYKTHIGGNNHVISEADMLRIGGKVIRLEEAFSDGVESMILFQKRAMLIPIAMKKAM